jgi:hypothetical protein
MSETSAAVADDKPLVNEDEKSLAKGVAGDLERGGELFLPELTSGFEQAIGNSSSQYGRRLVCHAQMVWHSQIAQVSQRAVHIRHLRPPCPIAATAQIIRRITKRGSLLAIAAVLPTTSKPTFSNIARVPTNAIVRSIRPEPGSTG